ncbi:MAG: Hsp20/alpha crystallin family protein [Verrucomicrobia bacterium]|nr:Hsp20/alpha crystallin family protein [Verrucomicrobiota bacterium]
MTPCQPAETACKAAPADDPTWRVKRTGTGRSEPHQHPVRNRKYHRIERSYGSFVRSFSIPDDAAPDKITADFKDGVLLVRLAKCEEKKPKYLEVTVN